MHNTLIENDILEIKKNLMEEKALVIGSARSKSIDSLLYKIERLSQKISSLETQVENNYQEIQETIEKAKSYIKTLPLEDTLEESTQPRVGPLEALKESNLSILFCYQNENVGTALIRRLMKKNYEVLTSTQLTDVIPLLKSSKMNLLIVEVEENNLDIFIQMQDQVLRHSEFSKIPLIVMTSSEFGRKSHSIFTEKKVFDILIKPIIPEVLDQKIDLALRQRNFSDRFEQAKEKGKILSKQIHQDPLTKLGNRAFFEKEIKEMINSNKHFYLIYADLDKFKPVNDVYGHQAGDWLLCQVAKRFQNTVRPHDYVCRLGGDEFVIIVHNDSEKVVIKQILDRILERVSAVYNYGGEEIKIGVSLGVTAYPQDASEYENLVKLADDAMYLSKNSGRNQYTFSDNSANQE